MRVDGREYWPLLARREKSLWHGMVKIRHGLRRDTVALKLYCKHEKGAQQAWKTWKKKATAPPGIPFAHGRRRTFLHTISLPFWMVFDGQACSGPLKPSWLASYPTSACWWTAPTCPFSPTSTMPLCPSSVTSVGYLPLQLFSSIPFGACMARQASSFHMTTTPTPNQWQQAGARARARALRFAPSRCAWRALALLCRTFTIIPLARARQLARRRAACRWRAAAGAGEGGK